MLATMSKKYIFLLFLFDERSDSILLDISEFFWYSKRLSINMIEQHMMISIQKKPFQRVNKKV